MKVECRKCGIVPRLRPWGSGGFYEEVPKMYTEYANGYVCEPCVRWAIERRKNATRRLKRVRGLLWKATVKQLLNPERPTTF